MEALGLGLSLGLGAGLAPGPLLVLVVGAALERGFAAGARVAAVPLLTDAPIIVVCILVLGPLPDEALAALSLAGAVFVAYLAVDALREHTEATEAAGLGRAALANVLSPHPWLFWITVGGPLVVDAGPASGAVFIAGFYATLVGTKIAIAGMVDAGRRRGTGRLLPRAVSARLATSRVAARFGATRIASAVLLGAAAVALLVDAISRL